MTAANNAEPESSSILRCELCYKPYDRRDLLTRHRRRCQGPRRFANRRKACNTCVLAKVKCCYTQPSCSRCARRGIACVYATSGAITIRDRSERLNEEETSQPTNPPSSSQNVNMSITTETYDMDLLTWDSSASPLRGFEVSLANLPNPPIGLSSHVAAHPNIAQSNLNFTPSTQSLSEDVLRRDVDLSPFPMPWAVPPIVSDTPPASEAESSQSSWNSNDCLRILMEYPSILMKDEFLSPFLHHTFYTSEVPDITLNPLTSMAICCGGGLRHSESPRFFRKAMDTERKRLIGAFPSYEYLEQWDALHAMLIYEDLELRDIVRDELKKWKLNPHVQGLRSPFLLKMIQYYSRGYPELQNPDINIFSCPNSVLNSPATSAWSRWCKTETARRMIFLANMINFYSNRNFSEGKQSSYYEPLNDELILNMPLPCSQDAWLARNEKDWKSAIENSSPQLALNPFSPLGSPESDIFSSKASLKIMLTRFSKDYIRTQLSRNVGFGSSDNLRNLIILCATEQFA
ncbi:C6 zinc finger domain protein [Xylogone sp. PMI_703]|nr:C6 zinc finger domain protein [Xylogone sp. PMI_703]